MGGKGHGHDDHQLPLQVYCWRGRSFVVTLVACDRRLMRRQAMEAIGRRCQIVGAALWLPEPFVTEPGIRTQ
jgi:hypothetical protein